MQMHQHQNNELLHYPSYIKPSSREQGFECPFNNATALGKGLRQGQWCPFYVIASHFEVENEAKWRSPLFGKNEFDGAINRECECKCEKDLVENNYNHAYFSYSRTLHKGIVSL